MSVAAPLRVAPEQEAPLGDVVPDQVVPDQVIPNQAATKEPSVFRTPPLWVSRLVLQAFRSYDSLTLDLDARFVVLTGQNGAGKTNVLEALSLLSPGRGLRGAQLSELQKLDQALPWSVFSTWQTPLGERRLHSYREAGGDKRLHRLDGALLKSLQGFADLVALTWLTPQQDGLFRGPSSERRAFFDQLVLALFPQHARHLNAYSVSQRQRSKILRDAAQRRQPADPAWLAATEDAMARHGVAIAEARLSALEHLSGRLAQDFGPFPGAELALQGDFEAALQERSAVDVEDWAQSTWARSREQDQATGRTQFGPHRSDLLVFHKAKGLPAQTCSTGEQKSLVIALILGHIYMIASLRAMPAVLLLDEVAAHLDAGKRDALFEALEALGAQVWMTGTEPGSFASLGARAQAFEVSEGSLQAYDLPPP